MSRRSSLVALTDGLGPRGQFHQNWLKLWRFHSRPILTRSAADWPGFRVRGMIVTSLRAAAAGAAGRKGGVSPAPSIFFSGVTQRTTGLMLGQPHEKLSGIAQ